MIYTVKINIPFEVKVNSTSDENAIAEAINIIENIKILTEKNVSKGIMVITGLNDKAVNPQMMDKVQEIILSSENQ
jgi:hypothetical protein